MSTDVLKQVVFFLCRVSSSQRFARLDDVWCLSPRLLQNPPFFSFFLCVLFRVLCDTLNPKKRHSLLFVTKKHFWGGCVPYKTKSVLWRASFWTTTATQKPLFSQARLFTTTTTRAKAAGYRPFVFVLFVFVSLEEEEEDKDEKEGGVSLGVVRV